MPPGGLVFRDAAEWCARGEAIRQLVRLIEEAELPPRRPEAITNALLLAGAIEAALEDAGDDAAGRAAVSTDALAAAYLRPEARRWSTLAEEVSRWPDGGRLRLPRPEGFAYYGLQPRRMAEAARQIEGLGGAVCVIGIRTIGTTLAAVVRAAFEQAGRATSRFSVRPTGHPFDRKLTFTPGQRALVDAQRAAEATFVVVDEGPGLSGSSFLAVGDALLEAGVPRERVVLLGSRTPDPGALVAPGAAERWRRFSNHAPVPSFAPPADGAVDLSGGAWRARFWGDEADWPATWPAMERLKFASADGTRLLKFEGLGSYGARCFERAQALAELRLSPRPLGRPDALGYVSYPLLAGRPLSRDDLGESLVGHFARYCTMRADALACEPAPEAEMALEQMARFNVELTLGRGLPAAFKLRCERPLVADGHTAPHEWFRTAQGEIVKLDATAHGDDHFFPGPTDVAWDLAGLTVEWQLDVAGRQALVEGYEHLSGDPVSDRLAAFEIAYAAFRACYTGMAAGAADGADGARLQALHDRYRAQLDRLVPAA